MGAGAKMDARKQLAHARRRFVSEQEALISADEHVDNNT